MIWSTINSLRTPMISECEKLIGVCDVSMQTELETVKVISKICERKRKTQYYNNGRDG